MAQKPVQVYMFNELDVRTWVGGRRKDLLGVQDSVSEIIGNVKERGDEALFEYAKKFDNIELDSLRVTEEEIEAAYDEVETRLVESLIEAEARISEFPVHLR